MRLVRSTQFLATTAGSLLAAVLVGGAAMAATQPASDTSSSVAATTTTVVQSVTSATDNVVTKTKDVVKTDPSTGATVTTVATPPSPSNPPPTLAPNDAVATSFVPTATSSNQPVAAVAAQSNDDQAGTVMTAATTESNLQTVESDWLAVSLSPVVAPVTLTPVLVDPQHHQQSSGLLGQLGQLLVSVVVPLSRGGGSAANLLAGFDHAIIPNLTIIALIMGSILGMAGYLSYLRRSGYAHAARSDADTAGTTNPATNGLLKRRTIGLVGGPFLVGLDNLMDRR